MNKMRLIGILLTLAFSSWFSSCSDNKTSKNETGYDSLLARQQADTLAKGIRATDSIQAYIASVKGKQAPFIEYIEAGDMYSNRIQPATFSSSSVVYAKPDTTSEKIATLEFNTPLNIISFENGMVEIEYGNKKGFIKSDDMVMHTFTKTNDKGQFKYFIKQPGSQERWQRFSTKIYKYDLRSKQFVDTLKIEGGSFIREIDVSNWKSVNILIYMNDIGACCGCTTKQQYFIDANNELQLLFHTSQAYSDGDENAQWTSEVILPMDPQIDTIVYSSYIYDHVFNASGEPVMENGNYKMKGMLTQNYYTWTGSKLVSLGSKEKHN